MQDEWLEGRCLFGNLKVNANKQGLYINTITRDQNERAGTGGVALMTWQGSTALGSTYIQEKLGN